MIGPCRATGRGTSAWGWAVRPSAPWWSVRRASRSCSTCPAGQATGTDRASRTGPRSPGTGPKRCAMPSRAITTLPEQLRPSLTWDQGAEMSQHARLRIDAGLQVSFCDPHSPWQRGTNENTNGLLRQYFPKGTDLSTHSADALAAVAATLNARPRKTLGWRTPAEAFDEVLRSTPASVATTP